MDTIEGILYVHMEDTNEFLLDIQKESLEYYVKNYLTCCSVDVYKATVDGEPTINFNFTLSSGEAMKEFKKLKKRIKLIYHYKPNYIKLSYEYYKDKINKTE